MVKKKERVKELIAQLKDEDKEVRENAVEALAKIGDKRAVAGLIEALKGEYGAKGRGTKYPNLKYAKPKYENVESILKYIESPDDKPAIVKLVIMNFND